MSTTIGNRAAILRGSKVHISINTDKLEESVDFYRRLFGTEPVKSYEDYAKFDLAEPALNLAINRKVRVDHNNIRDERPINHFGFELATSEQVKSAIAALTSGGFETQIEQEVGCCYGVQDKVWVRDPNGHLWEIFAILVADTGVGPACGVGTSCATGVMSSGNTETAAPSVSACCAPEARSAPTKAGAAVAEATATNACCTPSAKEVLEAGGPCCDESARKPVAAVSR